MCASVTPKEGSAVMESEERDYIVLCDGRKVMVGETITAGYRGEVTLLSVDQLTADEKHCCNCHLIYGAKGSSHHPQGEPGDYWGEWDCEIDGGFLNGSRIG